MAPPRKTKLAELEQTLAETVGAVQAAEDCIKLLEAKVSALLRQDVNAINSFGMAGG